MRGSGAEREKEKGKGMKGRKCRRNKTEAALCASMKNDDAYPPAPVRDRPCANLRVTALIFVKGPGARDASPGRSKTTY